MDVRAEAMPGLYNGGLHIDSDSLGIYNVWSGLHVLGLNVPELSYTRVMRCAIVEGSRLVLTA